MRVIVGGRRVLRSRCRPHVGCRRCHDQRLGGRTQCRGKLRATDAASRCLVRHQRQFDAGQIRGGRPHPCCFRSADANRVDQQDLHAAIAHRAREIVAARADAPTPPAAAHRGRTRDTRSPDRHRDRRYRPASVRRPTFAQHPQRVGRELPIEVQCQLDSRARLSRCRTKHRDQPRSVALRAGQRRRAARPPARRHSIERLHGTPASRASAPLRQARCSAVRRERHSASSRAELGPANRLAFRSVQRERAERRSLAHGSGIDPRAVAEPLATSLPSWLVVDSVRSTKCLPPSSRIADTVALASRSSPGHT